MTEKVEIAVKTHVGMVRSENQDHFCVFKPSDPDEERSKGNLVVVADGMGGHSGGSIASQTTTAALLDCFVNSQATRMRDLLGESILAGDHAVKEKQRDDADLSEMGTTCVSALIRGARFVVAHLGDSRCYMFRGEKNELVTRDHTYLNELIDVGLLTPEQAEGHPDKNIITRCVGMSSELEIDYNDRSLEPGDIFAMCSDGLSNFVDIVELGETVRNNSPDEACSKLIEMANSRGGDDNITIAVIKINAIPAQDDDLAKEDELKALEATSQLTPIIHRDQLDPRLLEDSEADTAEGTKPPNAGQTRQMAVTYDPAIYDAPTTPNVHGGSTTKIFHDYTAWYWLIGAEIFVLIVLQIVIGLL